MRSTPLPQRSYTSSHSAQTNLYRDLRPFRLHREAIHTTTEPCETIIHGKKSGSARISTTSVISTEVERSSIVMGLDTVRFCNDQRASESTPSIWKAAFYTDRLAIYPQRLETGYRSTDQKGTKANLTRGRFNGFVSRSSASQIRRRLESWIKSVQINKRKSETGVKPKHSHVVFLTVTLPSEQVHDDNTIKRKALMPFIQQLKREHGVQEYFWKAEPQENGSIHFHLLVDRYVPKGSLDALWVAAVGRLGYLDAYVAKFGAGIPPCCNVRVCPPDMSLVSYVMKYVAKAPVRLPSFRIENGQRVKTSRHWIKDKDENGVLVWKHWRPISGRVWGMSDGLRDLDVYRTELTYRIEDFLSVLELVPTVKKVELDHCTVFYGNIYSEMIMHDTVLASMYLQHYRNTYRQLYGDHGGAALEVLGSLAQPVGLGSGGLVKVA